MMSNSSLDSRKPVDEFCLKGLQILVVDDNADNLDLAQFVLEEYQAEVKTAVSVDEALELLKGWEPDVLISDLCMPGKDGYSLVRSIRTKENEFGGFLPAIALTGRTSIEDSTAALNAGFQKLIPKPLDLDNLVSVVASFAGCAIVNYLVS